MVTQKDRVEALMKDPPQKVRKQMKEAAAVDWDAASTRLVDWHRALQKVDCSSWTQFQSTRPSPKDFLADFPLQQVESMLGAQEFLMVRVFKAVANSRMLQLNLALKAWYLERDETPERLEQLVPDYLPAVPLDPFDGKPVRYDKEFSRL